MRLTYIGISDIIKIVKITRKFNQESKYQERKLVVNKRSLPLGGFDLNSELCRRGEIPSVNGHTNARSMALIASVMS